MNIGEVIGAEQSEKGITLHVISATDDTKSEISFEFYAPDDIKFEWAIDQARAVQEAPRPDTAWANRALKIEEIRVERNRRLVADFAFQGKMYQRDNVSLQRITGAATLAGFAVAAGSPVGNLRWANAERDFGWISSDNSVTLMDAQTAFEFGQVAASVETSIIFAAKAIREMEPIPENITDDVLWGPQ